LRCERVGRYGPRAPRTTKLDEHKDYLRERVEQARPRWIPATVLLREIRELGYGGGISQLKAWLAPLRKSAPEVVVRFETAPGKQMQVDFTWVRRGRDPLVALVATLGYSRATFVKFSQKEDGEALSEGLREALDYFGGVPEQVLFDNAKTVVIERDAYGPGLHRWNDRLLVLAEECGFMLRLCRPYRARTKGKVERFNGYLKGSFVVPLAASLHASGLKLGMHCRTMLPSSIALPRSYPPSRSAQAWLRFSAAVRSSRSVVIVQQGSVAERPLVGTMVGRADAVARKSRIHWPFLYVVADRATAAGMSYHLEHRENVRVKVVSSEPACCCAVLLEYARSVENW
jgi:transposase